MLSCDLELVLAYPTSAYKHAILCGGWVPKSRFMLGSVGTHKALFRHDWHELAGLFRHGNEFIAATLFVVALLEACGLGSGLS